MIDDRMAPLGAFLLRLSLGVMYLTHSLVLKMATFGLEGTSRYFISLGLPGWTGPATILAEAIGGALLVLGIWSRAVALALMPVLLGALWVHAGNGWVFSAANGGWEYPLFLVVISAVVALIGDGAYALKPMRQFEARPVRPIRLG